MGRRARARAEAWASRFPAGGNGQRMVRALLGRVAQVAPPIIAAASKPGPHCVLASAVGQMVLDTYGIPADPWSVEIMVFNEAWKQWGDEADFAGGVEEQGRRGAYMLSNSPEWQGASMPMQGPQPDKAWDGHLVLRVVNPSNPLDHPWLLDLDAGSFRRPAQQIDLPGGLVVPIHEEIVLGSVARVDGPRTHVGYRPMVSPFADDYRTAGDWVQRERYAWLVHDILDALNGERAWMI